ncbi:MAG: DUF485 domain-containing protein [Thermodesulfovibrionales bacterium]
MSEETIIEKIQQEADFKRLVSQKTTISFVLTAAQLLLYFGFLWLIAYNKPFLASKFYGVITWGIPIAIGTIILSWILTGIYILWANNRYDAMVKDIKDKIG